MSYGKVFKETGKAPRRKYGSDKWNYTGKGSLGSARARVSLTAAVAFSIGIAAVRSGRPEVLRLTAAAAFSVGIAAARSGRPEVLRLTAAVAFSVGIAACKEPCSAAGSPKARSARTSTHTHSILVVCPGN